MTTILTLNETERRIARHLAQERIKYDRARNARATLYRVEAEENELDSIGAEIAFCRLMNCYPDLDPTHYLPHDAVLPDGRTVDIKQTRLQSGRLLIKAKERTRLPDLYCLMVGQFPTYRVAGFVEAREILTEKRIDRRMSYPAYAIEQTQLVSLGEMYATR